MNRLIALTGKKQSGKTTVADHIVAKYGYVKINFKDALIDEIRANFAPLLEQISFITDIPVERLFDEKPPLVRTLLQCYGTEVRRADDKNYWVNRWLERLDDAWREGKKVVVDDVRFLNEAMAINKQGGMLIKVIRPSLISEDTHASEVEMDKIFIVDKTIAEDDIEELKKRVDLAIWATV